MKFIHTADWHLGKLVHNISMTEDQAFILEQLTTILKEEKPDCLVIAGDLYDRPIPPVAAVELLDEFFSKINIELNDSILNTLQYNENISISGNTEFNLPLIYGNVQNTINTRN